MTELKFFRHVGVASAVLFRDTSKLFFKNYCAKGGGGEGHDPNFSMNFEPSFLMSYVYRISATVFKSSYDYQLLVP